MCKKVGTKWFPIKSKRDDEYMDVHLQPSTIIEMSHEKTNSTVDEEEESHMEDFQSFLDDCNVEEELVPSINDV